MEAKHSSDGISASDLAKTSKSLKSTKGTPESGDGLDYDPVIANQLAALYQQHDGNLEAIFEELDENPRKALKYPPESAQVFGKKYAQGFYTIAEAK